MAAAGYELNPPIYRDGTYRFHHYAAGWEMWQAATAAERERCAMVAESQTQEYEPYTGQPLDLAYQCAAAIRAG